MYAHGVAIPADCCRSGIIASAAEVRLLHCLCTTIMLMTADLWHCMDVHARGHSH